MPCSGVLLGLIPGRTPKPVFSPSARPPERGVYPTALRGGGAGSRGRCPPRGWAVAGRGALTARGEEAHLPQEEGGVHVAQGLLHILKAAAPGQGQETKGVRPYDGEPRGPAPHPTEARG